MDLNHIALNEIPPQGATYKVTDEAVWVRRLGEFGVSCRIVEPVEAEVLVLPQEDGCLLRGVIKGVVSMPCNRCMEETLVVLNQSLTNSRIILEPTKPNRKGKSLLKFWTNAW